MRRIAIVAGSVLASLVLFTAPALATYHLNMVNEVMLSSSTGNSGVQFVELLDNGGAEELFTPVFAPYKLVIYDPAGNILAQQTLNPNGLRAAADADREYLVSTAAANAAFHVTGDERLTVTLPLAGGQACFEGSPQPPAVSCLTWGRITKPVAINQFGTGSVNGPVPPAGESDQRQPDKSILAACPTPKAPNTSKSCTTVPPAFAGVSFASQTATVDRRGRALVRLRCPAGTDGFCRGRVTLKAALGGAPFGSAPFQIASAKLATVPVKLSMAALRRLRRHRKFDALATAISDDAAGSAKTTTSRLGLRIARHRSQATALGAVVSVRRTRLGPVLVDTHGRTLYLFDKDHASQSTCFGQCAAVWPPLLTNGRPTAGQGVFASKLGTTRRSPHTLQVTYNGHPLYLYAGDSRAGQTNGEGLNQFGARWWAVTPAGLRVRR